MSFNPWDLGGPLFERTAAKALRSVLDRTAAPGGLADRLGELTARVLGQQWNLYPKPDRLSLVDSPIDRVLDHLLQVIEYTANSTPDGLFYLQDYFDLSGTEGLRRPDGAYRYGTQVDDALNISPAVAQFPAKWGYGISMSAFTIRYRLEVPFFVGSLYQLRQLVRIIAPRPLFDGPDEVDTENETVVKLNVDGALFSSNPYRSDVFLFLGNVKEIQGDFPSPLPTSRSDQSASTRMLAGIQHLLFLAYKRNPFVARGRGFQLNINRLTDYPTELIHD